MFHSTLFFLLLLTQLASNLVNTLPILENKNEATSGSKPVTNGGYNFDELGDDYDDPFIKLLIDKYKPEPQPIAIRDSSHPKDFFIPSINVPQIFVSDGF